MTTSFHSFEIMVTMMTIAMFVFLVEEFVLVYQMQVHQFHISQCYQVHNHVHLHYPECSFFQFWYFVFYAFLFVMAMMISMMMLMMMMLLPWMVIMILIALMAAMIATVAIVVFVPIVFLKPDSSPFPFSILS